MRDRRAYTKCNHGLLARHRVLRGDAGMWAQDTYWCAGAVLMTEELCSEVWSDAFNRTHVCDQPEGHDTTHVCHCGYEKGEGE